MKDNAKHTLRKDAYHVRHTEFRRKKLVPIISVTLFSLLIIAGAIIAFVVCLYTYGEIDMPTLMMLICGCILVGAAFVFGILYIACKANKKRRKEPFLAIKGQKEYTIVDKLASDIISESEVQQALKSTKHKSKLVFKEQVIQKQTNENVSSVNTFSEFSFYINQYFLNKGYKTNVGFPLVASLVTGPLIFLKTEQDSEVFIENINGCFNSPKLVCDASKYESIGDDHVLFDAINAARSLKDEEIILTVKNAKLDTLYDYLAPIEDLVFNNNRNATIALANNELKLPQNLYVCVLIDSEESVFALDIETFSHASILEFSYEKVEVETTTEKPLELGSLNIKYGIKALKDTCFLDEDYWKKIDAIEELFIKTSNYSFDNKMLLNLEDYITLLINNLKDQLQALDLTLANVVLVPALKHCNPKNFTDENDIKVLFNSLFDESTMINSRKVIDEYFEVYSEVSETEEEE